MERIISRTENVERRTSNVERRTSNVERRTSNVERRTLGPLTPNASVHCHSEIPQSIERIAEPGPFPFVPAGAAAEVKALGRAGAAQRIVGLVFEHQRVAQAEIAAGGAARLEPGALAIRKRVRLRRDDAA